MHATWSPRTPSPAKAIRCRTLSQHYHHVTWCIWANTPLHPRGLWLKKEFVTHCAEVFAKLQRGVDEFQILVSTQLTDFIVMGNNLKNKRFPADRDQPPTPFSFLRRWETLREMRVGRCIDGSRQQP